MPRSERDRLLDILEVIERIEQYASAGPREADVADARWDAILYNLVIVGEAARHVSADLRARTPEIDWSGAIGMRNVVTHDYFAMKRDIVARTVELDLPPLRRGVERLLGDLGES